MSSFSLQSLVRPPVAIYLRVSSDKQREAHTINGQQVALLDFLNREGIEPIAIYADDGVTGDLPFLDRPAAKQLLADADIGKFRTVLVYLYDRFSRDLYEGLSAARALKKSGVSPVSLLEPFDINTPFGEYMFAQSLNNAQLWKAQFLERSKRGQERKAREGVWQSGTYPYGYRIVGKKGHTHIEPAEHIEALPGISEADMVRQMYRFVGEEGKTCVWIAKYLNSLGVPSPATAKGSERATYGKWFYNTVSIILRNSVYKGVVQYGKETRRRAARKGLRHDEELPELIESVCTPLVPAELWETTQVCITNNQIHASKNRKREYALSGKLKCGNCGSTFVATTNIARDHFRTVYRCSLTQKARTHDLANPACIAKAINGDHLMQMLAAEIDAFFANPDELVGSITARYVEAETEAPQPTMQAATLEAAISAKEQEKQNILKLFRKGRITESELDVQLDDINGEIATLKEQVSEADVLSAAATARRDTLKISAQYIAAIAHNYTGFPTDIQQQRQLINRLVDRITITTTISEAGKKEASADVEYRFTPPDPEKKSVVVNSSDAGTATLRNLCTRMRQSGRIGGTGSRSSKTSSRRWSAMPRSCSARAYGWGRRPIRTSRWS